MDARGVGASRGGGHHGPGPAAGDLRVAAIARRQGRGTGASARTGTASSALVSRRDGERAARFEIAPGIRGFVDTEEDDIAGPGPAERGVDGGALVDDDLSGLHPAVLGRLDALHHVPGDFATLTAARIGVLAKDQDVEDAGSDPTELAQVLLAAIARSEDDSATQRCGRARAITNRRKTPREKL